MWIAKTGRKGACLLPKLKSLPPTLETFRENTKRAHFEACIIWKAVLSEAPPCLGPERCRWEKDHLLKSLCAIPLPEVVKLIQCAVLVAVVSQCSALRCGRAGGHSSGVLCIVMWSEICNNSRTKQVLRNGDVEDDDDDDDMDNTKIYDLDSVDDSQSNAHLK